MNKKLSVLFFIFIVTPIIVAAQIVSDSSLSIGEPKAEAKSAAQEVRKKWFETFALRGYTQVRYNRLLETNSQLKCDQCDRSIGDGGGIFFRRARLTLYGDIHPRVYLYIQTDLATNALINSPVGSVTGMSFLQLRDLYSDLFLNTSKSLRVRVGLTKIPYGFDNLQSSQNRLALDRSDAINSGMYNERDMAVLFYFTPAKIKERYKYLTASGLKGTGDYGVLGFGVFNGQTTNRLDYGNAQHVVAKLSYPFKLTSGQFIEVGVSGFTGYFNTKEIKKADVASPTTIQEQRIDGYIVVYPQPFGFQAEYNWGMGPRFTYENNVFAIQRKPLDGGYAQVMYRQKMEKMVLIPYVRAQYYNGGKKIEQDARSYVVKELECGVEWQLNSTLEFTMAYMVSDRTYEDSSRPENTQKGNLLRLQLQFNY